MVRWGFVLFAGCAQLAGIDDTSKGMDAGPPISTLQLEHVAIGKRVVTSPHPLAALNAAYLVPDPAAPGGLRKVVPTVVGTDTWSADTGGVAVPIQFQADELPNANLRILDFPTPTLRWTVPILEHPNPTPAPPGSTLDIEVNLETPHSVEGYQLFTLGAWANVGLVAPAIGGITLLPGPLALLPENTPTRRLDKITTADSVLVLRYSGNQLVGHLDAPAFDQTAAANRITGTLANTVIDKTLDIRVHQNAAAQRLATVRPAVAGTSYVWRVHAAPGLDYSIQAGPQLNAEGVLAPTEPDPQTISAAYGNPFSADYEAMLIWDIRAGRTYTSATSMMSVGLAAGFTQRARPSAALDLAAPAGLPDRITANTAVLNVDNVMVNAPLDAPVEFSFVTDASTNSLYVLQLLELVPTMAMTYNLTVVVTAHAAKPGTKLPRELFKPGSLYVMRAFSFAGCYPSVATGDLAKMSLPCAFSFADSGVFQVAAP